MLILIFKYVGGMQLLQKIISVKTDFRKYNVYGLPKSCTELAAELRTCRFFLSLSWAANPLDN